MIPGQRSILDLVTEKTEKYYLIRLQPFNNVKFPFAVFLKYFYTSKHLPLNFFAIGLVILCWRSYLNEVQSTSESLATAYLLSSSMVGLITIRPMSISPDLKKYRFVVTISKILFMWPFGDGRNLYIYILSQSKP